MFLFSVCLFLLEARKEAEKEGWNGGGGGNALGE